MTSWNIGEHQSDAYFVLSGIETVNSRTQGLTIRMGYILGRGTETHDAAQEERTPMVTDNSTTPTTSTEPVTIDAQLDQLIEEVETMKDTVQDHLTGLKTFGTKLKGIQREHKSSNKEIHTIRQSLKALQGVKP